MNRVLIFAGGKGVRMKTNGNIPKQFLKIKEKPIIIYTLEKFERNQSIDDIVVVCIESWIDVLKQYLADFNITKVSNILPGGKTGFESRINGLKYLYNTRNSEDDIVLIHDGVRPFITDEIITENVNVATEKGNAITIAAVSETIIYKEDGKLLDRDNCLFARAPQTFKVNTIYEFYERALEDGQEELIDSATIAQFYGEKLNYVNGPAENMKITTPIDFYAATGILCSDDNGLKKYQ